MHEGGVFRVLSNAMFEAMVELRVFTAHVRCAICGFEAVVRPRVEVVWTSQNRSTVRALDKQPDLWICDIHLPQR